MKRRVLKRLACIVFVCVVVYRVVEFLFLYTFHRNERRILSSQLFFSCFETLEIPWIFFSKKSFLFIIFPENHSKIVESSSKINQNRV